MRGSRSEFLDRNKWSFEVLFSLLQYNGKNYRAIELDPASTLTEAYDDHLKVWHTRSIHIKSVIKVTLGGAL
jgi:hypothetical protein